MWCDWPDQVDRFQRRLAASISWNTTSAYTAARRSVLIPDSPNRPGRVGRAIAEHGFGLVYGGGRVGLMGIVADAVLEAGGRVIGVIPEPLAAKEIAHQSHRAARRSRHA